MTECPPISETLSWIQDRGYYCGQITHHRAVGEQQPVTANIDVADSVRTALTQLGIASLYEHQVEAIGAIRDGDNMIVATPTASGKTLTYVVPAAERALNQNGKTLYIAPYRALINDQADTFREFGSKLGSDNSLQVGVQTGDTPQGERRRIKQTHPDVLLVTLDQVHYSLLPYGHASTNWQWLFQQLDYVVIDEIHKYRGIFGSHASLIFRRLNRLCEYYNTDVQYICCSATIGNPVDHAANVAGQTTDSFNLVDTDQSASGERHWVFWNPPLKDDEDTEDVKIDTDASRGAPNIDGQASSDGPLATQSPLETPDSQPNQDTGILDTTDDAAGGERKSNHSETVRLFADLVAKGYQTLVFTGSRQGAEQYTDWSDQLLRKWGQHDVADDVHAYTAALDNDRRRDLESGLRSGEIRGVWSTNALELGIDIGTLDVVLLDGYPGTSMSTFQRAGRAGRGQADCLVVMIGSDNPLDQYVFSNPDQLFDHGPETATVNPTNDAIRPSHVQCAAHEQYLTVDDRAHFGEDLHEIVTEAVADGNLRRVDGDRVRWASGDDDPQWNTNIRSIDNRQVDLIDRLSDKRLVSLEFEAALRDAHPNAIYHHQKSTYKIAELNLDTDTAFLEQTSTSGYTQALREKDITIQDTLRTKTIQPGETPIQATLAEMTVSDTITGYLQFDYPSDTNPVENEFDDPLPPVEIDTTGLFFTIPPSIDSQFVDETNNSEEYLAALHATEHALISLFPTEVLCDRSDIGGLSTVTHSQTTAATVFVHDGHPGGAGLTRAAFDQLDDLLTQTHQLIASCGCGDGCPSCIHSPQCGNANRILNRDRALSLLSHLTGE